MKRFSALALSVVFEIAIILLLLIGFVSYTLAAEKHVYPGESIQEAINNAYSGDIIIVGPGTYAENINFYGKAITIKSTDPSDPDVVAATIIDGNQSGVVVTFENEEGPNSILSGITIQNGKAKYGAGINCDVFSSPTITNCIITKNSAVINDEEAGGGGGICCYGSSPNIINCTISYNSAEELGGGILDCYASPNITNCTISNNSAAIWGGGIADVFESSPYITNITNCTFNENSANYGGGIYSYSSSPNIASCTITENSAGSWGGGIRFSSSLATTTNCTISENSANYGGGIYCNSSSPNITNCTISDNLANIKDEEGGNGGGIYCYSSSPDITKCIIKGNSAVWGGGITCYESSSPTITNCTIKKNSAGIDDLFGKGGGIYCNTSCMPLITDCTISYNSSGYGGGIQCEYSSSPTITKCTINENSASLCNGGIGCYDSSSPNIANCTIMNNTAVNGGGIGCYVSSSPDIINCTIKKNSANGTDDSSGYGGGIQCEYSSSPTITTCTINENSASLCNGGIGCYESSSPNIANCSIINNTAANGGGIGCYESSDPNIINCTIVSNSVQYSGGGIICKTSTPTITNCTLYNNSAGYGGGINCCESSSTKILNCILWANTATVSSDEIYSDENSSITVTYSDIKQVSDSYSGVGNINHDPLFVDPSAGKFHLTAGSPCRDKGNPGIYDPDNSRSDMGAYGGPGADWDPIVYSLERYWMKIGESHTLKIPASAADPNVGLSYSTDNPKFTIDPNGIITYAPVPEDQKIYPVQITVQDEEGRESIKDISIIIWDTPVYVKSGSSGDGSSWENALGLIQEGIENAYNQACPEVWVARGTYRENITLKEQVYLYGGFSGEGEEKDYESYETIIDGNHEDSVVIGANEAGIDGFTIINGQADDGGGIYCVGNYYEPISFTIAHCLIKRNKAKEAGGGIYCLYSIPRIVDNAITLNETGIDPNFNVGWGGGIYSWYSFILIKDNHIIENQATRAGGGIVCESNYETIIEGNEIKGNTTGADETTGSGGGLHIYEVNSSSIIRNNKFINNRANYSGGGINCENSTNISIEKNTFKENIVGINDNSDVGMGGGISCLYSLSDIRNNTLIDNRANLSGGGILFHASSSANVFNNVIFNNQAQFGGGIYTTYSTINFINCTLFGNDASGSSSYPHLDPGDGFFCTSGSTVTILNTILWDKLWDNEDELSADEIFIADANSNVTLSYSDTWGGYSGQGNIQENPLFVNPVAGIFHLTEGSPCRNTGDPNIIDTDGSRSDMGAYGGPGADWDPIVYGSERYWMKVGQSYTLKIPASAADMNMSLNYSTDNPKFTIDPNGIITYVPVSGDQDIYPVQITVQDEEGRESIKNISIIVWDTPIYVKAGLKGDGSSWDNALGLIQEGINTAYEQGCPEVWVAQAQDNYCENITLKKHVYLYGGFSGEGEERDYESYETVIDGNQMTSVVIGADEAGIEGFTITNGLAEYGGGIYCKGTFYEPISFTIADCLIKGNHSEQAGGGIYCLYTEPNIVNNEITLNKTGKDSNPSIGWGGGIYCGYSFAFIKGNHISANHANRAGGGITCSTNYSAIIEENKITENTTGLDVNTGYGGGLYIYKASNSSIIRNNEIINNQANYAGGGINCEESSGVIIEKNTLTENIAGIDNNLNVGIGGGIRCIYSSPDIRDNNLIANRANLWGGGILFYASPSINVLNNLIIKNLAYCGGGICGINSSSVDDSNSHIIVGENTIKSNSATYGGGVYSLNSDFTIKDNVIADNYSYTEGLEIYGDTNSAITIENSALINSLSDNLNRHLILVNDSAIEIINSAMWPTTIGESGSSSSYYFFDGNFYALEDMANQGEDILPYVLINMTPSSLKKFASTDEMQELTWSLAINNSIGTVDQYGTYTSGPNGNIIDVIKVSGDQGSIGWAVINIVDEHKNPGIAVVICGSYTDSPDSELNEEFTYAADYAYRTLMYKGFKKENIMYLHANPILSDFEDPNNSSDIICQLPQEETINDYLSKNLLGLFDPNTNVKDQDEIQVVLYMVGHGASNEYRFNDDVSKNIDPNNVNSFLSIDPNCIGGEVKKITTISILDFCRAGSFINRLKGKNKICITSCSKNQETTFPEESHLYFSTLLFNNIRKGERIGDAFWDTLDDFSSHEPQLEATNDDYHNGDDDHQKANIHLGWAIPYGGEWEIQEISETQYITDPNNLYLEVKVTNPSPKIKVFANIKSPYPLEGPSQCQLKLGNGIYKLKEEDKKIFRFGGKYILTVYAHDTTPSIPAISKPESTLIIHQGQDFFEDDNSPEQAKIIYTTGSIQNHTLHSNEDEDWLFFFGYPGNNQPGEYTITAHDAMDKDISDNIQVFLYDPNLNEEGQVEGLWSCQDYGFYYLKIERAPDNQNNEAIIYDLSVAREPWAGDAPALLLGRVIKDNGEGVNEVRVQISSHPDNSDIYSCLTGSFRCFNLEKSPYENQSQINLLKTESEGWYFIPNIAPGSYDMQIIKKGTSEILYNHPKTLTLTAMQTKREDISFDPNDPLDEPTSKELAWKVLEGYPQHLFDIYKKNESDLNCGIFDDYDEDGINNLEELIFMTYLDKKEMKTLLYPGLNLFPFSASFSAFASNFFFDEGMGMIKGIDSIWGWNYTTGEWTFYNDNDYLNNFEVKNGDGYLIYIRPDQVYPQIFFQEEKDPNDSLLPGFNLRGALKLESIDRLKKGYTSFQFLQKPGIEKPQYISKYNNKKASWESAYQFFAQPTGAKFDISPTEAYLIMQ